MAETKTALKPKAEKRHLAANWLDIEGDEASARAILTELKVPDSLIEGALAHGALPRFDLEGTTAFLLLRVFDQEAEKRAASARELTRKIAIILTPGLVVTVHRFPTPEIPRVFKPGEGVICDPTVPMKPADIVATLFDRVLTTYQDALLRSENQFDSLESAAFNPTAGKAFRVRDAYLLRRRLAIEKRMLALTLDALDSIQEQNDSEDDFQLPLPAPIRRRAIRASHASDTLHDGINQLVQLHVALVSQKMNESSQRTNEVMRILTVFSAFFLPLSFVAGIFGMNFENMPELRHPWGYGGALLLMASMALGIFIWFRKRGWIGKKTR